MNIVKKQNSRPNLYIQVEEPDNRHQGCQDQHGKNQVTLKPLRSAKNTHELKGFQFSRANQLQISPSTKMKELAKLEQQKQCLMKSLHILKTSAVEALVEKQDQIQKLKSKGNLTDNERMEFYEKQLESDKQIRSELQQEISQMEQQIEQQKEYYTEQLHQKQSIIEQLCQEIQEARRELDRLEESEFLKSRKIKLLTQENNHLSFQLQVSILNSTQKAQHTEEEQSYPAPSFIDNQSSIEMVDPMKHILSESSEVHPDLERTYLSEKIQEVNKVHKQEIIELRGFYEKRIKSLRDIYERELNLPTQSNEEVQSNYTKKSKKFYRYPSINRSSRQQDTNMQINIPDRMYSIDENIERQIETARSNLQEDIRMQNMSNCPQHRFNTNEDTQSQFTAKYFENPFRKMDTKMSSTSFHQDEQTNVRTVNKLKLKARLVTEPEIPQPSIWSKSYMFAAGLVSGATITAILNYAIKKIEK